MKIITPNWNRQNLDDINENFSNMGKGVGEVKEELKEHFNYFDTADANKMITTGLFYIHAATNFPATRTAGMLKVMASHSGSRVHQECYSMNAPDVVYVRGYSNEKWSDWISINSFDDTMKEHFNHFDKADANDFKSSGSFYINSGTNFPEKRTTGMLWVVANENGKFIHQLCCSMNAPDVNYVRGYSSNRWSEWTKLISKEDLNKFKCEISKSSLINPNFDNGLNGWTVNSGEPKLISENGANVLVVDGEVSQQLKQTSLLVDNHIYYTQLDVSVSDHIKGGVGIQFNGNVSLTRGSVNLRATGNTKGWLTLYDTFKVSESKNIEIFLGSLSSANLKGKLKNTMLYDLTEIYGEGNEPSASDFKKLNLPCSTDKIELGLKDVFTILDNKIDNFNNATDGQVTDAEAEKVFVEEMNKKCQYLGMTNTVYKNPHGLGTSGQVSTALDTLKLTRQASGIADILKHWGAREYEVEFRGSNPRTEKIIATVTNSDLEKEYDILGGKSGTLPTTYNALALIRKKSNGRVFLASVIGSDSTTNRYTDILMMANEADKVIDNNEYKPSAKIQAKSAAVYYLDNASGPLSMTNIPLVPTYAINENQKLAQASMTKVMTTLLVLENVHNLNERYTMVPSDIAGGSGPKMYAGDNLSFKDAIHLMMLPSSNTAAKTMARVVGHKIIKARGYK